MKQATLFDTDQPVATEGSTHPPCFYTMLARELLGAGNDWIVAQMECLTIHDGKQDIAPERLQILLTGAVYPNKRGIKWGKPQSGTSQRIVVTEAQRIDAMRRWEVSTGKCADCGGCGQRSQGWERDKGAIWVPCKRCKTVGKAPEVMP